MVPFTEMPTKNNIIPPHFMRHTTMIPKTSQRHYKKSANISHEQRETEKNSTKY